MDTGNASNVYLSTSPFPIQDQSDPQKCTGDTVLQPLQQDGNDCLHHLLSVTTCCGN